MGPDLTGEGEDKPRCHGRGGGQRLLVFSSDLLTCDDNG